VSKTLYLCIACDADPDIPPTFPNLLGTLQKEDIWQGYASGIPALRQRLIACGFGRKYGNLPITWLLRSDRQIYEIYGDAAFCFRQFEPLWKKEMRLGSEIGWHPHLYRWSDRQKEWQAYLGQDDDLEILSDCLASLRQHADIRVVRTGWDYHSNRLMAFFDRTGLVVDASALPGCSNSRTEVGLYNWVGTPRVPYFPSQLDYRQPPVAGAPGLKILEIPAIVRRLRFPLHLGRYFLRIARALRSSRSELGEWETARWQGIRITMERAPFYDATQQALTECVHKEDVYLTTYFHTDDLLFPRRLELFARNLEGIMEMADRFGFALVPCTLSAARRVVT
jgi:hypothetical protein